MVVRINQNRILQLLQTSLFLLNQKKRKDRKKKGKACTPRPIQQVKSSVSRQAEIKCPLYVIKS